MRIGDKFTTKSCGDLEIINFINHKNVEIEFIKTKTRKTCQAYDIVRGSIKDPFYPCVYGVGVVGNEKISLTVEGKRRQCPYYTKWHDMIKRCYSYREQERHPTYIDCFVCEEWKMFSNFKNWMKKQSWKGKHLDKDLLVLGNKKYSPENCVFIDSDINIFLRRPDKKGYYVTENNNFRSQCWVDGKVKTIGTYGTEKEARNNYVIVKNNELQKLIDKQKDDNIKVALSKFFMQD